MRHPKFRERISEEPEEMLEKERCYVTRIAWRAPVYERPTGLQLTRKANALLELPKGSLSSVFREDRRLPGGNPDCFMGIGTENRLAEVIDRSLHGRSQDLAPKHLVICLWACFGGSPIVWRFTF
jgi:hypothetical protein